MRLLFINLSSYQIESRKKRRAVDRYMLYVIYLASMAMPLYLFRILFDTTLLALKGEY